MTRSVDRIRDLCERNDYVRESINSWFVDNDYTSWDELLVTIIEGQAADYALLRENFDKLKAEKAASPQQFVVHLYENGTLAMSQTIMATESCNFSDNHRMRGISLAVLPVGQTVTRHKIAAHAPQPGAIIVIDKAWPTHEKLVESRLNSGVFEATISQTDGKTTLYHEGHGFDVTSGQTIRFRVALA